MEGSGRGCLLRTPGAPHTAHMHMQEAAGNAEPSPCPPYTPAHPHSPSHDKLIAPLVVRPPKLALRPHKLNLVGHGREGG